MAGLMFPSLDGSDPGSQESISDVTGIPLEKVEPNISAGKDYPLSSAAGDMVSQIPGRGPPGTEAEAASNVAGSETVEPGDAQRRGRTPQDRISQITKKYRNEERKNDYLGQQLDALQAQIQQKDQAIQDLSRRVSTIQGPRTEQVYGDLAQVSADQAAVPAGVDLQAIRQIVGEAIAPLAERQRKQDEFSRLQGDQQVSLAEAAEMVPELNDPNSPQAKSFREIWAVSPLRESAEGPLHVALMVRGAYAEEAPKGQVEARKRAASVVSTGPASLPTSSASPAGQYKQIYKEGLRNIITGDDSYDNYIAARKAQRRGIKSSTLFDM